MNGSDTNEGNHGINKTDFLHADAHPTVLHVDDCPNDAMLVQAACQKANALFHLQNVEGGEQAIAYLDGVGKFADRRRFPSPSLILLDLKMPRANGVETIQWIRCHPLFHNVPILVLSGSELKDDMQRAFAAGANSYFVKPLKFESLVALIQKISATWLNPAMQSPILPLTAGASPISGPSNYLGTL